MAGKATTVDELRKLVRTCPLIDNHAHNLLRPEEVSAHPFESITTEASDAALQDTFSSLSHMRAVNQLARLFECEENWTEIEHARDAIVQSDYEGLVQKCFEGTAAILMDDGLDPEGVYPYKWHDRFCRPGGTKRIVRIETVAQDILRDMVPTANQDSDMPTYAKLFPVFTEKFRCQISDAIKDDAVVGFKSVICYRSGLDVKPTTTDHGAALESDVGRYLTQVAEKQSFRIDHKAFNDFLVTVTLELLSPARPENNGSSKPIQFHTGLGDSDISLLKSNPAYLQPLIESYPHVDFVLLHASYPYTREAGYLASVFKNVYLDVGEVFPMLSRDGQESVLRQSLELTPGSKILWSTDGHWHPETYWLANQQFRAALEEVLVTGIEKGDYSPTQAAELAIKILYENSNQLYGLGLTLTVTMNGGSNADRPGTGATASPPRTVRRGSETTLVSPSSFSNFNTMTQLDDFLAIHPEVRYIWMQFLDYTGIVRVRMVPTAEFKRLVRSQSRLGVTTAVFYLLHNDHLAPGGNATGQFYMEPDLSTLSVNAGLSSKSASVMTFWRQQNGEFLEGCPRTTLARIVDEARRDFGMTFLLGFEIEVVFVKPEFVEGGEIGSFAPYHTNHAWSGLTYQSRDALSMVEEMVETLASVGIHLTQFHAEAAPGQWEFILPPYQPLQSVDTLIRARQVIGDVARKHGLKATLYPRPYPEAPGTASHAHFSVSPLTRESAFLAGVLEHLPAILAFTMPMEPSYERIASGIWAGGEYVAWGTQNKETPIRKIEDGHYELKCADGLANMYFGMAALLAGGLLGVMEDMKLTLKDCPDNASNLDAKGREEYGITKKLPKSLDESLFALMHDLELKDLLGHDFVKRYNMVKKAEKASLREMGPEMRRTWLMERY